MLQNILSQIKPCDTELPYIFISYSSQDNHLVWEDVLQFQKNGYNIWLDEKNLDKTNESWKNDVLRAIEDIDCYLFIFYMSQSSLCSESCYQELKQTISPLTQAYHHGPLKFIVVEAEPIHNLNEFTDTIYEKIRTSNESKETRHHQALALAKIIGEFFDNNNERVRIHYRHEENRVKDYYEEIQSLFPEETYLPNMIENDLYLQPSAPEDKASKEIIPSPLQIKNILMDFDETEENIKESSINAEDIDTVFVEDNDEQQTFKNCLISKEPTVFFSDVEDIKPLIESDDDELSDAKKSAVANLLYVLKQINFKNEQTKTMVTSSVPIQTSPSNGFDFTIALKIPEQPKAYNPLKKKQLARYTDKNGVCIIPDEYTSIYPSLFSGVFQKNLGVKEVILPDSMYALHYGEFKNYFNLAKIKLPKYITEIPYELMKNCRSLTEIQIPGNVEKIGFDSFSGCSSLKHVVLSQNLKEIGECAFMNCKELTEIIFPPNLEKIERHAFLNCTALKKIVFLSQLQEIESYAFGDCTALEEIQLPDGLITLAHLAFCGCLSLKKISIPGTLKEFSSFVLPLKSCLQQIIFNEGTEKITTLIVRTTADELHIWIPDSVIDISIPETNTKQVSIIHCHENSFAHNFAKDNDIRYVLEDEVSVDSNSNKIVLK